MNDDIIPTLFTNIKALLIMHIGDIMHIYPIFWGKVWDICEQQLFPHILVIHSIWLAVVKFYVVFLLVNNYDGDVVVSTGLPGTSGEITMKPGDTVAVSEQPNNNNPISVTAAVAKGTTGKVNINRQSSVSITPAEIFGASFQVLFIYREDPSK